MGLPVTDEKGENRGQNCEKGKHASTFIRWKKNLSHFDPCPLMQETAACQGQKKSRLLREIRTFGLAE